MLGSMLKAPWFWTFLAVTGWGMGIGLVGTQTLGRSAGFGIAMLILAELPRILLTLPFVSEPRISPNPPPLAAAGPFFGTPVFGIVPLTGPDRGEPLRTDGLTRSSAIRGCCAISSGRWVCRSLRFSDRHRPHAGLAVEDLGPDAGRGGNAGSGIWRGLSRIPVPRTAPAGRRSKRRKGPLNRVVRVQGRTMDICR